jgi:hypothetical protein
MIHKNRSILWIINYERFKHKGLGFLREKLLTISFDKGTNWLGSSIQSNNGYHHLHLLLLCLPSRASWSQTWYNCPSTTFFFSILWCSRNNDDPLEDLVEFGYKWNKKVNKIKHYSILLPTYKNLIKKFVDF